MRNIDSSQWLAEPSLQIVETGANNASAGSSFTLFANQRVQATADDVAAEDAAGKPRNEVAAR